MYNVSWPCTPIALSLAVQPSVRLSFLLFLSSFSTTMRTLYLNNIMMIEIEIIPVKFVHTLLLHFNKMIACAQNENEILGCELQMFLPPESQTFLLTINVGWVYAKMNDYNNIWLFIYIEAVKLEVADVI